MASSYKHAVLLGVYAGNPRPTLSLLLNTAHNITDNPPALLKAALLSSLASAVESGRWGVNGSAGQVRIVYDQSPAPATIIAFVGLGRKVATSALSPIAKERVRLAASAGVRSLYELDVSDIYVDGLNFPHGAAEGAHLGLYIYKKHGRAGTKQKALPTLHPLQPSHEFASGTEYALAQNLSRYLTELPANLATPMILAQKVQEEFAGRMHVTVNVYDEAWMAEKKMGALLSVSCGSAEAPRFVEIVYKGAGDAEDPTILVGKGVTFDSGGISLKPGKDMHLMKGDMGGAATVISALSGASKLRLPINVVGIIPFVENMPSAKATKPGDVVIAANGLSIEVINTDAEGRMILADALHYACTTFRPSVIIDFATLTGAVMVALGSPYAGVFSTTDALWAEIEKAGIEAGDPFWRMPMHKHYKKQVATSIVADLVNSTQTRYGGACTAAAFLSHFVKGVIRDDQEEEDDDILPHYAHIDIASVSEEGNKEGYQPEGMTGRPTRSVLQYLSNRVS